MIMKLRVSDCSSDFFALAVCEIPKTMSMRTSKTEIGDDQEFIPAPAGANIKSGDGRCVLNHPDSYNDRCMCHRRIGVVSWTTSESSPDTVRRIPRPEAYLTDIELSGNKPTGNNRT